MTEGQRRPYREFGSWLRARRMARRWTQEALASRLGYDVTYVRKIEWGARRATEAFRARLAEVFELPVESLPDAEGRAASVSAIPTPATSLVGRDAEVEAVSALLREGTRLVTLVGAPGIGKTRLAIAVATGLDERLEHGARFVPLVTVAEAPAVAGAVCEALGLRPANARAAEKLLADHLAEEEMLLVLDNLEHVLSAATLVGRLLSSAPRLRVLATSRQALDVAGETQYPVPPLPLDVSENRRKAGATELSPAVALFVDRARMVRPSFTASAENTDALIALCARLDGVPLAIELTAAAMRLMSPAQLLGELDHVLDLPTTGPRGAPAHQRTLRATIDWSHRLLSAQDRALFARLGVFVGGFTLEAAAGVCTGTGTERAEVVQAVASLVGKSLLETRPDAPGGPRVVLLEPIREYALERLRERQGTEELGRRHAAYYAELAETAAAQLVARDQAHWLDVLGDEHGNLLAALRWAIANDPGQGLRLAGALWRFWLLRGHFTEGRVWLEQALARCPADHPWRARAATGAGVLARMQGDYRRAQELFETAAAVARRLGNDDDLAHALLDSGIGHENQGHYDTATTLFEQSLSLYRALGNERGAGHALNCLGNVALDRGDTDSAVAFFEQSMTVFRSLEDHWSLALAANNLGWVADISGDAARARTWYGLSLGLHRGLGDDRGIANTLCNIGRVELLDRDLPAATAYLEEALLLFRRLGERRGVAECLEELARVAVAEEEAGRATRLYSAATVVRQTIGAPRWPKEQQEQDRTLLGLREQMTDEAFEHAWDEGQAMTTDDTITLALTRPDRSA